MNTPEVRAGGDTRRVWGGIYNTLVSFALLQENKWDKQLVGRRNSLFRLIILQVSVQGYLVSLCRPLATHCLMLHAHGWEGLLPSWNPGNRATEGDRGRRLFQRHTPSDLTFWHSLTSQRFHHFLRALQAGNPTFSHEPGENIENSSRLYIHACIVVLGEFNLQFLFWSIC